MSIRVKPTEWKILFGVSGTIDIIQIIIGFFGVGIIVNEIADLIIGVLMVIYFLLRGFSVTRHMKLFLALIAVEGVEELTGGFAPAWTFDVYNAKRIADNEVAGQQAEAIQEELTQTATVQPLNQNGVRTPATQTGSSQGGTVVRNVNLAPNNVDGVRHAGTSTTRTGNVGAQLGYEKTQPTRRNNILGTQSGSDAKYDFNAKIEDEFAVKDRMDEKYKENSERFARVDPVPKSSSSTLHDPGAEVVKESESEVREERWHKDQEHLRGK